MNFLMNYKIQRYHNLYNKFYIGYMSVENAKEILNLQEEYTPEQKVVVAIEKKHSDEIILTYYIQKTRKNLYLYSFDDNGKMTKEKKDPYGITVTEVFHIGKMMNESYELNSSQIATIKKLLKERYKRQQSIKD
jgi:hypothetical protein